MNENLNTETLTKITEATNISPEIMASQPLDITSTLSDIDKFGELSAKAKELANYIAKRQNDFATKLEPLTKELADTKKKIAVLQSTLTDKIKAKTLDESCHRGERFALKKRTNPISRYISPEEKEKFIARFKKGDAAIDFVIEDYRINLNILKVNPNYNDYVKKGMVEEKQSITISPYPIK